MPELDAKIAACDKELLGIKAALARTPAAQQASLKQKAVVVLKRRKIYEGQRGSVQARAFNLEQTQFAMETVKDAQEHMAVRAGGGAFSGGMPAPCRGSGHSVTTAPPVTRDARGEPSRRPRTAGAPPAAVRRRRST